MKKTIIFDFNKTIYDPYEGCLYRGSYSLLQKLNKNYYLILVTTYSPSRYLEIEKFKLNKYFTKIFIVKRKNLNLYKNLSLKKPAILIGDNLKEEIRIGKKLKFKVIIINALLENPIKTIRKELLWSKNFKANMQPNSNL